MTVLGEAVRDGRLQASLAFVASDAQDAPGLKKAEDAGFETAFLPYAQEGRKGAEERLKKLCSSRKVEWIVLAGFMRILSPDFVRAYSGRIINIHPSLLPSFPGRDGIGDAWRYGVKVTGVTVHIVDEGVDSGPILAQRAIEIRPDDTLETLEHRIHDTEHALYWNTLSELFKGCLSVERRC